MMMRFLNVNNNLPCDFRTEQYIVGNKHIHRIVGNKHIQRIVGNKHIQRIVGNKHIQRIVGNKHNYTNNMRKLKYNLKSEHVSM